jgi:oligoribonuclease
MNTLTSEATRLVWIDLEMTGLDPHNDHILEIASIITDTHLTIIAEGPELVIQCPEEALISMSPEVRSMHEKNGLIERVRASNITRAQAEEQTLNFLQTYCINNTSPLCGNSIWQDKRFLSHHMPSIVSFLHYRIIDVSSIKQLVRYWYEPKINEILKKTIKKDTHRALIDIHESIQELALYRSHYFKEIPTTISDPLQG